MIAVLASNASISLKSFFSNPFTTIHFQFFPALRLFPTIPLLPLTHITLLLTTDKPRRLVLMPVFSTSTEGRIFLCGNASIKNPFKNNRRNRKKGFLRLVIRIVFRKILNYLRTRYPVQQNQE